MFIDDEVAANVPGGAGVPGFALRPDAVGLRYFVVFVDQQRVGEVILGLERAMRLDIVGADSEDFTVVLLDLSVVVAEPATLNRSTAGVVLGIKPEDYPLPEEVAQLDLLSFVGNHLEAGSWVSNFELTFGHLSLL